MRVVTIDGPAGAGKSTVSRRLAERLGWRLLDTGAMYRAVTLAALRAGTDLGSDAALGDLAARVSVKLPPGLVLLDGEDVSSLIRSVEVTRATGPVADSPGVRTRLVGWQRAFAAEYDVVTEGRDQGTIVFPDALRKFFLTASPEERARRRQAEFAGRGESIAVVAVLNDLRDRDARDAARAIAPMKPADDARVIDTTGLPLDEVVGRIERIVLDRLAAPVPGSRSRRGRFPNRRLSRAGMAAETDTDAPRAYAHCAPRPLDPWLSRLWYETASGSLHDGPPRRPRRLAGDRPSPHPPRGGGADRLEPHEPPRRLRPGDPEPPAVELRGAFDPVPALARALHPLGRWVPDPARGDGGVGCQGDAPAGPQGGDGAPLPRRDPEPRRPTRRDQARDRRAGDPGARAGRPRGPGGDLRGLAPEPPVPPSSLPPARLRRADPARTDRRPLPRGTHRPDRRAHPRLSPRGPPRPRPRPRARPPRGRRGPSLEKTAWPIGRISIKVPPPGLAQNADDAFSRGPRARTSGTWNDRHDTLVSPRCPDPVAPERIRPRRGANGPAAEEFLTSCDTPEPCAWASRSSWVRPSGPPRPAARTTTITGPSPYCAADDLASPVGRQCNSVCEVPSQVVSGGTVRRRVESRAADPFRS